MKGFSLIEVLIATAITLVVTGALVTLVSPSQGVAHAQAEAGDLQQRLRVATDALSSDLMMAGAGPEWGGAPGSLAARLPAVRPCRPGAGPGCVRADALSLVYVPAHAAHAIVRDALPAGATRVAIDGQPDCPTGDSRCGFRDGMVVVLFDDTGAYELADVASAEASTLRLDRGAEASPVPYDAGWTIAQAVRRVFYLDPAADELRRAGGAETGQPIVDDVVELAFELLGDPRPPLEPRPPPGGANCLIDGWGQPRLPALDAGGEPLAVLAPASLVDGPWCGRGPAAYDADLLRLRAVRITLAVQAASPAFRGQNPAMFHRPGTAQRGERFLPDLRVTFDVAPPNLALAGSS